MSDRSPFAVLLTTMSLALAACGSSGGSVPASDGRPEIAITVNAEGYEPAEASAAAGAPVRLLFTRTTDEGCGQQLVIPSLDIQRDLPLDQPVAVDITMPATGRLRFTCGMDMYEGAIVAN